MSLNYSKLWLIWKLCTVFANNDVFDAIFGLGILIHVYTREIALIETILNYSTLCSRLFCYKYFANQDTREKLLSATGNQDRCLWKPISCKRDSSKQQLRISICHFSWKSGHLPRIFGFLIIITNFMTFVNHEMNCNRSHCYYKWWNAQRKIAYNSVLQRNLF